MGNCVECGHSFKDKDLLVVKGRFTGVDKQGKPKKFVKEVNICESCFGKEMGVAPEIQKHGICDRCKQPTDIITGSYFNTECICLKCEELERKHPSFKKAKDAELEEVKNGNWNFEGVGLPEDLKP